MKESTKEEIINEYESLPVNSKKFDEIMKKYLKIYPVKKKKGKQYVCISIAKKIGKDNYRLIKTIYLEEFK